MQLDVAEDRLAGDDEFSAPFQTVNILCICQGLRGLERIVADLCWSIRKLYAGGGSFKANLFVLSRRGKQYSILTELSDALEGAKGGVRVWPIYMLAEGERLAAVATGVLSSGTRVLYSFGVKQSALEELWKCGVRTMLVLSAREIQRQGLRPQAFPPSHVPGIIALSEKVRDALMGKGHRVPVYLILHQVPRLRGPLLDQEERSRVRQEYGICEGTALIGMIGRIRPDKHYRMAITAFHRLQADVNAKLMIVGSWSFSKSRSLTEYRRLIRLVRQLGVEDRVIFVRGTRRVGRFLSIFDVFLNTSQPESLGISILEAQALGLPTVSNGAGGHSARCAEGDVVLDSGSQPEDYASALKRAIKHGRRPQVNEIRAGLTARLWCWIAASVCNPIKDEDARSVLFLTNNLAQGGAQRSLINLLAELQPSQPVALLVLSGPLVPAYMARLAATSATFRCLQTYTSPGERVTHVLNYIAVERIGTLCFWNVDFRIKALIAKVLSSTGVRLIDVSPGPSTFRSMENSRAFLNRTAYSIGEYFRSLHSYVTKYYQTEVPSAAEPVLQKLKVIPNGVPIRNSSKGARLIRPSTVHASHAVVSVGRIVPAKLVDRVLRVAARLRDLDERITVSIVGRTDAPEASGYFKKLQELHRELDLGGTVFFVGEADNAIDFLPQFRVFLMLSKLQGCPNSSLEAMAAGLPVVANPDGGTSEQVEDGTTGYLVNEDNIEQLAQRVKWLLDNPEDASRMGERGRNKVITDFSMEAMSERYRQLLWPAEDNR